MVKFESDNPSKEIVYIFLDRISEAKNNWTAELIKNLSDYVLSNILTKGYNVIQGIDEDELLNEAAKDYSYAVVLTTGTEFINGDAFFKAVDEFTKTTDFFLLGHIPDRDDGYYELHEQCYVINLNTFKEIGRPAVGKFEFYSSHLQIEPLRSKENIHDDYTPLWVKPGTMLKEYKHKWHGWKILSEAFKNNKPVLVFNDTLRNSKRFYYPNYEPAFLNASTYLYGKNQIASQTLFYPYNTEATEELSLNDPIRQLVIQASGLQFYDYLVKYGYNKDTVVRFVDYNLFALECMYAITQYWDGEHYMDFVNGHINSKYGFVKSTQKQNWITLTGSPQTVDPTIWNDIRKTVKFEFRHEDLVLNKGLEVNTWIDQLPNTVIHLSHIFNYDPVATFYPLKHRVYSERLLLNKIKNYIPDAIIVMNQPLNLKRPTWHMNGDWDGI